MFSNRPIVVGLCVLT